MRGVCQENFWVEHEGKYAICSETYGESMLYMYYRELRPHSPPKKGYRPPIPILVAPNFIVLSLALPTAGTYLALSISSRP